MKFVLITDEKTGRFEKLVIKQRDWEWNTGKEQVFTLVNKSLTKVTNLTHFEKEDD